MLFLGSLFLGILTAEHWDSDLIKNDFPWKDLVALVTLKSLTKLSPSLFIASSLSNIYVFINLNVLFVIFFCVRS
jgi:hypothetical protein